MGCVRYYLSCKKCAYDFYSKIKPMKKCPKCESIKVILEVDFDESDDHKGSIKSDDGDLRWCE